MPRGVNHIDRVISHIAVQVLRPWVVRVAGIAVLAQEPACSRLVEPRVHILQAGGLVVHAAGKGHFIQELGGARLALYVAKLVVGIACNLAAVRLYDVGRTAPYIRMVEALLIAVTTGMLINP